MIPPGSPFPPGAAGAADYAAQGGSSPPGTEPVAPRRTAGRHPFSSETSTRAFEAPKLTSRSQLNQTKGKGNKLQLLRGADVGWTLFLIVLPFVVFGFVDSIFAFRPVFFNLNRSDVLLFSFTVAYVEVVLLFLMTVVPLTVISVSGYLAAQAWGKGALAEAEEADKLHDHTGAKDPAETQKRKRVVSYEVQRKALNFLLPGYGAVIFLGALLGGLFLGTAVWEENLHAYYTLSGMQTYVSVDPSFSSMGYWDTGRVIFKEGSAIDAAKASSFKEANVKYCAAPVTRGASSGTHTDFWVVGVDCCGVNQDGTLEFFCGDHDADHARGGTRDIDSDSTGYFKLAVDQATKTFGLTVSAEPVFLHWKVDPLERELQAWAAGFDAFMFHLIIGGAIFALLGLAGLGLLMSMRAGVENAETKFRDAQLMARLRGTSVGGA
uniref:Uncharacterized protein n=1 Tax=Chromera velia CCMP2878 TaxID=1169474 RepID=A0A0G4HLM2_9ALVE|eukprot:Cvel_28789.t1-p1 / transcript=Cvel_28789.t1 / gene=Cvel_28789 / organism=Chromera_velia_CCMP2878 / gene_product=hypothetical protein / transcript_product=hypothetical protein / location=Cvel_scaffold3833:4676-8291(-) / protein_length=435 / sequence_SO=supercontig / SO=protein_coding / is_pseudo=false